MDSKINVYALKIMILFYIIIFCLLSFILMNDFQILWLCFMILLIGLGILFYIIYQHSQKQMSYLIQQCENIIEDQPMSPIDGEGNISILSFQLAALQKRYHALLHTMSQEQIKLKDYIENISHQLKTPMTSMRLNEEMLMDCLQGQELLKVQHIYQQTLKIETLVNDLLTLALLDSHSIQFHFQLEDITMMIEDIENDLDYLITQHDAYIHLQTTITNIMCDYKWFKEALINILKNCIEYSQHQTVDIHIDETETLIRIVIRDYGQGFSKEDLKHIFERFYRGQNKQKNGIGIGMSMVKEIIEAHHGSIHIYNQNGAVFKIYLPKIFAKKKL